MGDMQQRVVELLEQLVAIPSIYPPGDTSELCAHMASQLKEWGYEVEIVSCVPGIDNVIARMGSGKPELAYNCHIDTVAVTHLSEWESDPYSVSLRDGRVYGLGVNNCKGPTAAQMWAAEQIAKAGGPAKGSVVFTFTGDEEALGPNGTALLRNEGYVKPDMLVVGAQTENDLIIRERGVTWIELTVHGASAHAGAPQFGDNAIMRAARLLTHLEKHLMPEIAKRNYDGAQSTINIGTIQGGNNINVVPSSCTVAIDRRLMPVGETIDGALEEIRTILSQAGEPEGSFSVRRLTGTNGFMAPKDGPLVSELTKSIEDVCKRPAQFLDSVGAFDGRFFADDGIEIVNFGPGEGNEGHKSNESTPLDQLLDSALIYRDVAIRLLGTRNND